jgi:dolichyl-phosphate-mannose-protein mannosyltransferase
VGLTFAWQVQQRRASGDAGAISRALREQGPSIVAAMIVLPAVVYVASYIGRLDGAIWALPWAPGSWGRAFLSQQRDMLAFHIGLQAPHVYGSAPWSWPLLKRPVVYDFEYVGGRFREILAVGNPFVWWPALVAIGYVAVRWLRGRRSSGEAMIVVGFAAGWVPWFAFGPSRPSMFIFYFLPSVPFLCLALGYVAERVRHARWGRRAVMAFAAVGVASFAFFYPVLAAVPISQDAWQDRVLFSDCSLQGVTLQGVLSTITLPSDVAPPTDIPGPYPEATLRGAGSPLGWCWI